MTKENYENIDTSPYDNPDKTDWKLQQFLSTYLEWIRRHVKSILFVLLVISALALAVLFSIIAWSFFGKDYALKAAQTRVSHKHGEMSLYSHNNEDFKIPIEKTDLSDSTGNTFIETLSDSDFDRPKYLVSNSDSLDQPDRAGELVAHNDVFEGSHSDSVESNSPDEFRIEEHSPELEQGQKNAYRPSTADLLGSKFREENAAARDKSVEIVELKADTVPAEEDEKKHAHHVPPGNPKPTTPTKKAVEEKAESRHVTVTPSSDSVETPAMTLYRVHSGVKAGAVCLDGSPPAYYHRPGTGSSEKLWILHFNGGAWCFDEKACFERSHSSLGSTKKLPTAPPIIQGINSPDPSVNPDFYDWNLVWVVYCDGASFTGNRERPLISDSGETIYMRGKRVINAIVNDLLFNRDFKFAEAIILTGSSAGSMTAIFQADYIASKFPKTIPVRILSDAGFFIDTAPIGGKDLGAMFKRIYEMQNSSAGLDQDCVRDMGIDAAWQCFFPVKTAKYVKTPMFILNSAYDFWALLYFLDIDCKFPAINQQQRRKRSLIKNAYVKSDSELDLGHRGELERFMFKRQTRTDNFDRKRRRDVSGFEILPFFRKTESRYRIPSVAKTMKNYSETKVFNDSSVISNSSNVGNKSTHLNLTSIVLNDAATAPKDANFKRTNVKQNTSAASLLSTLMQELGGDFMSDEKENTVTHKQTVTYTHDKGHDLHDELDVHGENDIQHDVHGEHSAKHDIHGAYDGHAEHKDNMDPLLSIVYNKIATGDSRTISDSRTIGGYPTSSMVKTTKSMIPLHVISEVNETINADQPKTEKVKAIKNLITKLKHFSDVNKTPHTVSKYKNQTFSKIPKIDAFKSRRSTSIAKEYINILRSDPPECTEKEILDAMKYRSAIMHATDNVMHMPKSGRFLVSCIDHSLSLFDETWAGLTVAGKSIQQAFGDWFYERGNKPKYNFVDCPYPCNPTCP